MNEVDTGCKRVINFQDVGSKESTETSMGNKSEFTNKISHLCLQNRTFKEDDLDFTTKIRLDVKFDDKFSFEGSHQSPASSIDRNLPNHNPMTSRNDLASKVFETYA